MAGRLVAVAEGGTAVSEPQLDGAFDPVDFFTDESLIDDPFPYFDRLRAQCPVTVLPHHGVVAVTGYDEASELWRDPATYSACVSVTGPFPGLPTPAEGVAIDDHIERHRAALPMNEYLATQDPPDHTASRGLLMRLLTPRRMKENEAFMARLVDRELDRVVPAGTFEVFQGFAKPFALLVIADLLGVPEEDHNAFAAQLGVERPDPGVGDGGGRTPSLDPLAFLFATFSRYIEDRRSEPRQDVLTQLATATYPDGSIPEIADVVRTATFLFAAGQDTTARLITAAVQMIGEDPALQARLRAEREHLPEFLEEVLRLEGPVKTVSRLTRTDTTLGGVAIPAGTTVSIFPHAANRDPRHFEAPNELRLGRPNARENLAFGRGIHVCPGAPLARVEARIAIDRILDRALDIRISEAAHGPAHARRYTQEPTYVLRGLRALHITFTPA
jgi:cytochrome P450